MTPSRRLGQNVECLDTTPFLFPWGKVASASKNWTTWLSTHEARRVEVERAKGRGCLTRSVKLAQLVRYCSSSAEAVTIVWSAAPLRACPRRSTWPITRRRGRGETPKGFASGAAALRKAPRSPPARGGSFSFGFLKNVKLQRAFHPLETGRASRCVEPSE
jgi:hypothetical protein